MNCIPILFDYSFAVYPRKDGFLARVEIKNGRLLAAFEEDEWAFYGVEPAGVAGQAEGPQAAFEEFKQGLSAVADAYALESTSFADFKKRLTTFLGQVNEDFFHSWAAAVADVKSGKLDLPIPRRDSAVAPSFTVDCIRTAKPQNALAEVQSAQVARASNFANAA